MASTFDNDLRLEEMATGENAGSWGTKTNTNLELIADAFGYGTFTIADADTTLTIPDGSGSDNALRSLYLKISSSADLTTTRVLTIDPNTVSKLWYIENNTSGGQTITISQGSGANVSILNGQAKLVATDGAGATAAVIDATQDLAIPDLFIDDDLSLQSDGAIINFGADADITLTHAADTSLTLGGAGTTTGLVVNNTATDGDPFLSFALSGTQTFTMGIDDGDSDKFKIGTSAIGTSTRFTIASNGDIAFYDDGGSNEGLSFDASNSAVTITNYDTGAGNNPDLILFRDSSSPLAFDGIGQILFRGRDSGGATNDYVRLQATLEDPTATQEDGQLTIGVLTAGTNRNRFSINNSELVINQNGIDSDFRVESDSRSNALVLDGGTGNLALNTTNDDFYTGFDTTSIKLGPVASMWSLSNGSSDRRMTIDQNLYVNTDGTNRYLTTGAAARYQMNTGTHRFETAPSGSDDAQASDLAVQMLILNSGDIRMGLDNSTEQALQFRTSSSAGRAVKKSISRTDSGATNPMVEIQMDGYGSNAYLGQMNVLMTPNDTYNSGQIDVFNIAATTGSAFNDDGVPYVDFRIESDNDEYAFFVDAGADRIGINKSNPSRKLDINHNNSDTWGVNDIPDGLGITNTNTTAGTYTGISLNVTGDGANAAGVQLICDHMANGTGDFVISNRNASTHNENWRFEADGGILGRPENGTMLDVGTRSNQDKDNDIFSIQARCVIAGSFTSSGDASIRFHAASAGGGNQAGNEIHFYTNFNGFSGTTSTRRLKIKRGGTIEWDPQTTSQAFHVNSGGQDNDFIVQSDSNAYNLYSDGNGAGFVSVGAQTPSYNSKFNVSSGTNTTVASFESALGGAGAAAHVYVGVNTRSNNGLRLSSNGSSATVNGGALAANIVNSENASLYLGANNALKAELDTAGRFAAYGLGYSLQSIGEPSSQLAAKITSSSSVSYDCVLDSSTGDWSSGYVYIKASTVNSNQAAPAGAWWFYRIMHYNGTLSSAVLEDSGGTTSAFTITISDQGGTDPITMRVNIAHNNNRLTSMIDVGNYYGIASIT